MYGNGQAPIFILKEGTQRTRGRSAQSNNIAAAKAVADSVRSTLGPKGMDKMLVDSMGDVSSQTMVRPFSKKWILSIQLQR